MNVDEINNLLDVNFKSSYILSSLVVSEMKKKKWGRIINIGSISGVVGEANATLYSATKSAFNGFTKALALEVAMDNITINTINPGWVETPLAQNSLNSEEYQEVMEIIPQKRFVEPIEVAKLCEYLITDNAKGITGQSINLCAGLTCGC
jgi:NAD(P)-dependent dehydrogenase (short-subunit alcohol dehydrogenase family)